MKDRKHLVDLLDRAWDGLVSGLDSLDALRDTMPEIDAALDERVRWGAFGAALDAIAKAQDLARE